MDISSERKAKLEETYQYYFHNEKVLKMKEIPDHRGSNCYLHTFKVAKKVIYKALKSRKELDLENLLVATIFHDYYLYDWRTSKDRVKPHGKTHPYLSAENAKRDFNISDKAIEMIKTHMWPLNFTHPPKGKEAWMLCDIDTKVAFVELITSKKHKQKKERKYLKQLETLF